MSKTIILFDVDGTLTDPRKLVKENMLEAIKKLKNINNLDIAIVGGSNLDKQKEQLGDHNLKLFDYVFSENGLVSLINNDGNLTNFHSNSFHEYLGNQNYEHLINDCLEIIRELQPPVKTGTFIESRTGMINVSPVGRNCNQKQREEFFESDKIYKYREHLIKFLQNKWRNLQYYSSKEIPNLTFSIGGQISVDIFPEGWDKTYCLQFIKEKYDRILFFGDKTSEGGNDYEIYEHELTESYTVTSPEDTIQKLQSLFNI